MAACVLSLNYMLPAKRAGQGSPGVFFSHPLGLPEGGSEIHYRIGSCPAGHRQRRPAAHAAPASVRGVVTVISRICQAAICVAGCKFSGRSAFSCPPGGPAPLLLLAAGTFKKRGGDPLSASVRVRHLPALRSPVHDGNDQAMAGGKGAMETGFALSEIDTTTPHPARMYDALLGRCFL